MIDSEREIRDRIWSIPEDEVNFCPPEEAFAELSIACFVPGRGEDGIRDRGEIGVGAHQSASSAEILWSTLRWRSQTRNEYRHFRILLTVHKGEMELPELFRGDAGDLRKG